MIECQDYDAGRLTGENDAACTWYWSGLNDGLSILEDLEEFEVESDVPNAKELLTGLLALIRNAYVKAAEEHLKQMYYSMKED